MSPGFGASWRGADPVGERKTCKGDTASTPGVDSFCASNTAIEPCVNAITNIDSFDANAIAPTGPINGSVRLGVNGSSSSVEGDANAVRSSERLETMSPTKVQYGIGVQTRVYVPNSPEALRITAAKQPNVFATANRTTLFDSAVGPSGSGDSRTCAFLFNSLRERNCMRADISTT